MADALVGRDIVCVGFNDWDNELWTNQHHLMARLGDRNRVLFVESLGLRRPQLTAGRDVRRIARRLRRGVAGPRTATTPFGEVRVLSPLVLPLHGVGAARAVNARLLPLLVRRAARAAFPGGSESPILWGYVPQAELLLDTLAPQLVVYHCVDDIAAQEGIDEQDFRAAERRYATRADLVIASAPALAERMRGLNSNVLYAPNVADTAAFAAALAPGPGDPAVEALSQPRIVFTGAIAAKKLDVELLTGLARARRDWAIALVGPVGLGDPGTDVAALQAEPNIHLLGARPYADLPAVLRGAQAALIPYRLTELTASIFPMKVYEYLAAGLPVVATPLPALHGVAEIATAADVPATVAALEHALASDSDAARAARSAAAASHSWDARLTEIDEAIAALPRRGR
jgi:glycosyltransferase involved in cell wall biosynthesis